LPAREAPRRKQETRQREDGGASRRAG
jgi:hypothetical protein